MEIMDLRIVDVFSDYLKDTKQLLISDVDAFEDKINALAPDMIEECYLLVKAIKSGIYDMILFNHLVDKKVLIDYFVDKEEVNQEEAVFCIGVIEQSLNQVVLNMSIMNIEEIKQNALDNQILYQIKMIALAYYEGEGVNQDFEEAFQLFSYLGNHGDQDVYSYLGYMLEHGLGVEEDIVAAIDYYEKGCLLQDEKCLYYMGLCYLEGKGYVLNERMALVYLKRCHFDEAYKTLGSYYQSHQMNGEAFYYYSKAANTYDRDALFKIGTYYLEGKGTSKNIGEAKKYLTYASYFNQPDSFCHIGLMMIEGIGFNKDVYKGLEYIRRSANLKCRDAYLVLGKFYEFGQYVKKDIAQATYYYSKFNEKDEWNEGL